MPLEAILSAINIRPESFGDRQSIRETLAAEAIALYPVLGRRIICREATQDGETRRWFEPVVEELVDDTTGNWATDNMLRAMNGFVMGLVVWSASMAYGGVHAVLLCMDIFCSEQKPEVNTKAFCSENLKSFLCNVHLHGSDNISISELLEASMPISHISFATATARQSSKPSTAPVLVNTAKARGSAYNEAVHEIGDGFSTSDA
ncbi:MAG: hypothetical protein Q9224_006696 [Gallowayella concinna]